MSGQNSGITMSPKIEFNLFQVLFRGFAYIADKSENWRVFVRPVILVGLLTFWIGLTSFGPKQKKRPVNSYTITEKKDSIKLHSGICVAIDESESHDINIGPVDTTTYIFNAVEQMAQFPGGNDSILNFISKNIKWPEKENDNQGTVVCRFVINQDGSVSNVVVARSLEPCYDEEAIRVVKSFPKFIPAIQNCKAVRVYFTVPVNFKHYK